MTTRTVSWILRVGAAGCFIGHGAFGIITKAAWVPYFGVVGIPEAWAWKLMPWVGTMDIIAGILALVYPTRLLWYWGVIWCFWTALLRPLSGEPFWETLERAGNYGVPAALLVFTGLRGNVLAAVGNTFDKLDALQSVRLNAALRWTTATLLAGHAGLGIITHKALLAKHYAAVGLPTATMLNVVGGFEFLLALCVLLFRHPSLLLIACSWKMATELLFPIAGAPWWEFIERFGSYTAPLALAAYLWKPTYKPESALQNNARSQTRLEVQGSNS